MAPSDTPCPHCGENIELLEPADVDAMGLPWTKRTVLRDSGDLKPWAVLRGDKLWLYLRRDVVAHLQRTTVSKAREELRRLGVPDADRLPDQAVLEMQKVVDTAARKVLRKYGFGGDSPQ